VLGRSKMTLIVSGCVAADLLLLLVVWGGLRGSSHSHVSLHFGASRIGGWSAVIIVVNAL
jgi:hypothetical protein